MPWQNQRPELSTGAVAGDANDDVLTDFVFSITYKDVDNDAPTVAKVTIDGIDHAMTASASTYSAGVTYTYKTKLFLGFHYYNYTFNDGNTHEMKFPWKGTQITPDVRSAEVIGLVAGNENGYGTLVRFGADQNTQKWKYTFAAGEDLYTPVISNGNIYVGSTAGKVYAFSMAGSKLWETSLNSPIRSAPLVTSSNVYVFSDNGLYSLNVNSGSQVWSKIDLYGYSFAEPDWLKAEKNARGSSSIVMDNNVLYMGGVDSTGKVGLYAINSNDGSTKWVFTAGLMRGSTGNIPSTPFVANGKIYFTTNSIEGSGYGKLYVIDTSGNLVFGKGISDDYWTVRHNSGDNYWFEGTPVVDSNNIYVSGGDGETGAAAVFAFSLSGSLVWKTPFPMQLSSSPTLVDSTVAVSASDGYVYTLAKSNGKEKWHTFVGGEGTTPVMIGANMLVKAGGKLFALKFTDGSVAWTRSNAGPYGTAFACDPVTWTCGHGTETGGVTPLSYAISPTSVTSITPMSYNAPSAPQPEATPVSQPTQAITANAISVIKDQPKATVTTTPVQQAVKEVKAAVKPVVDAATQKFNEIRNAAWDRKVKRMMADGTI